MNSSEVNYLAARLADKAYEDPKMLLDYAVESPAHITGATYGADVFIFEGSQYNFLVVRGTEVNEELGFREVFNALRTARRKVDGGNPGRPLGIHLGFYRAYHEISDLIGQEVLQLQIEQAAEDRTKPWVFCGHSAGGAIATICAAVYRPEYLVTFGAPRVGGKNLAAPLMKTSIYRWVRFSDWVPRVPAFFGYRHAGTQMYITARGRVLADPSPLRTGAAFLLGLPFSGWSHGMLGYLVAIAEICEEVEE